MESFRLIQVSFSNSHKLMYEFLKTHFQLLGRSPEPFNIYDNLTLVSSEKKKNFPKISSILLQEDQKSCQNHLQVLKISHLSISVHESAFRRSGRYLNRLYIHTVIQHLANRCLKPTFLQFMDFLRLTQKSMHILDSSLAVIQIFFSN